MKRNDLCYDIRGISVKALAIMFCIIAPALLSGCTKKVFDKQADKDGIVVANHLSNQNLNPLTTMVSYGKDSTTTITSLPLDESRKVLYSLPVTLQPGDVVSAHLQQELTEASNTHLEIVGFISFETAITGTTGSVGFLTKPSGSNLYTSEEGAAEIVTRTGSYKNNTAAPISGYINAVFYAGTLTSPNPANVVVPAGRFGELVAVVERGVGYSEATAYAPGLPYDSGFGKSYAPASPALAVQYTSLLAPTTMNTMVDVRFLSEATSEAASSGSTPHGWGKSVIVATAAPAGATQTASTWQVIKPNEQTVPRYYEHHNTQSFAGGAYLPTGTSARFNAVVYSKNVTGSDHLYLESAPQYGTFKVETRPYNGAWKDTTRNITSVTSTTGQILYSVGPIDVNAGDLLEIRYHAVFAPTVSTQFTSEIIRSGVANATTGISVQPHLWRRFGPQYQYSSAIHSTAELITTSALHQYYNVIVTIPGGGTLPVQDWGQLEVVKR
jgi:hypothetical protein